MTIQYNVAEQQYNVNNKRIYDFMNVWIIKCYRNLSVKKSVRDDK